MTRTLNSARYVKAFQTMSCSRYLKKEITFEFPLGRGLIYLALLITFAVIVLSQLL